MPEPATLALFASSCGGAQNRPATPCMSDVDSISITAERIVAPPGTASANSRPV